MNKKLRIVNFRKGGKMGFKGVETLVLHFEEGNVSVANDMISDIYHVKVKDYEIVLKYNPEAWEPHRIRREIHLYLVERDA